MRRWLPRSLWLFAWSLWAWLGWGLYRELPRDLGRPALRLPLGDNEILVGLLDAPPAAVTIAKLDTDQTTVRLWDFAASNEARSLPGPLWLPNWHKSLSELTTWLSSNQCLLVTNAWWDKARGASNHYSVLDLKTGAWRMLDAAAVHPPTIHPEHPWGLFLDDAEGDAGMTATVLDLRTGSCLFRWPDGQNVRGGERLVSAFFVGADGVALSLCGPQTPNARQERFVDWWVLLPSPRRMPRRNIMIVSPEGVSKTGRIVWQRDAPHSDEFQIYDLERGEFMFDNTKPHPEESSILSGGFLLHRFSRLLSPDGRVLFDGSVQDLECGRPLWQPRMQSMDEILDEAFTDQSFIRVNESASAASAHGWFETRENWRLRFRSWEKRAATFAMRNAWTGAFDFRCWSPLASTVWEHDGRRPSQKIAADRHWMVDESGLVYHLPPPPNYPLLALCQAILALPLVLLWAALRWRRKRRMRLASAAL